MILLADRHVEPVDFDLAGLLGEFLCVHRIVLQGMQRFEKRRRETTRRTEACLRGDVGHMGNLEAAAIDVQHFDRFANDRMFQRIDRRDAFQFRIPHQHLVGKTVMQRDVDVFVDRGRDQFAFVFAIVRGKIRSAAAKRDTKRATHDYHINSLFFEVRRDIALGARINCSSRQYPASS